MDPRRSTTARARTGLLHALVVLTLSACAAPNQPLYYWGDYQPAVYAYFKGDAPGEQEQKLEETAQKAGAHGAALPPGFYAHLGLLYLNDGQADQARSYLQKEKALFPESGPYMDFLLQKLDVSAAGETQ